MVNSHILIRWKQECDSCFSLCLGSSTIAETAVARGSTLVSTRVVRFKHNFKLSFEIADNKKRWLKAFWRLFSQMRLEQDVRNRLQHNKTTIYVLNFIYFWHIIIQVNNIKLVKPEKAMQYTAALMQVNTKLPCE